MRNKRTNRARKKSRHGSLALTQRSQQRLVHLPGWRHHVITCSLRCRKSSLQVDPNEQKRRAVFAVSSGLSQDKPRPSANITPQVNLLNYLPWNLKKPGSLQEVEVHGRQPQLPGMEAPRACTGFVEGPNANVQACRKSDMTSGVWGLLIARKAQGSLLSWRTSKYAYQVKTSQPMVKLIKKRGTVYDGEKVRQLLLSTFKHIDL